MESDSPPPTPSQKESIDQILQAGWYLLELINEILDLATIESGQAVAVAGAGVAGRGHARMPGHDRAAGAKARHQHDLSPVRHPLLRRRRSDPREAGAHQPAFQRDQVQPGEQGTVVVDVRASARRNAFASASGTPARACLRRSWRSSSSRSIVSDRRPAPRKAPASAWW